MLECSFTAAASSALLAWLRAVVPGLAPEAMLYCDFDMQREDELAMTTMIAAAFSEIWDSCQRQRPLPPARLQAVLLARAHVLSRSRRHRAAADRMRILVATLPA
jgi:hypothetical protein